MGGMMMIWWTVVPLLSALVLWFLFKGTKAPWGPPVSAEATLKQRYAKGDIDRETFQRMLEDIKSH